VISQFRPVVIHTTIVTWFANDAWFYTSRSRDVDQPGCAFCSSDGFSNQSNMQMSFCCSGSSISN